MKTQFLHPKFANKTFVSSVAWTESVGFMAGISVIDFFTKKNVAKHLIKMGNIIKKGWEESAKKNNILISIGGMRAIPTFRFNYGAYNEKLYTIFTSLMLKEKYLATSAIYLSHKHNLKNIKKYLIIVDKVFKKIEKILKNKKNLNKFKARKYNY